MATKNENRGPKETKCMHVDNGPNESQMLNEAETCKKVSQDTQFVGLLLRLQLGQIQRYLRSCGIKQRLASAQLLAVGVPIVYYQALQTMK